MDFAYIKCVLLLVPVCLGQTDPTTSSLDFEVSISPMQSPYQLNFGEGKLFSCSASATADGRKPELRWEFNDEVITTNGGGDGRSVITYNKFYQLQFTNAKDEDGGFYKCVGKLDDQEVSATLELQIIRKISVESKESQFGILGEDGKLMCKVSANPLPEVSWRFEDQTPIENSDKYVIRTDHLEVKNLEMTDSRKYVCYIFVISTGESFPFLIDYEVVKLPTISKPPVISSETPKVGDNVRITCRADGIPAPTFRFKKGAVFMPDSQVDSKDGVLTLENLQKSDEATYTCVATNRGGNATKSNKLDVMVPPTIEDIPSKDDAAEDTALNILCQAKGDPMPEVTWKKKDMQTDFNEGENAEGPTITIELKGQPTDSIKQKDAKMSFIPVKARDAGVYVCTAKSKAGTETKEMTLGVLYKPNFDTDYKVKEFYGWQGHTTNMTCQARGNPLSQVAWKRSSTEDATKLEDVKTEAPFAVKDLVTFPDKSFSSKSLMVTISGEDSRVYGDYVCFASNIIGNLTQTITLKQAFAPEKPIVSVKHKYSTMVIIAIKKPTDDGGQPVTKYQYTYSKDGAQESSDFIEKDATGEYTEVELRGMTPTTEYVVNVKAGNAVGFGVAEKINVETLQVSVPMKLFITSPHFGTDSESYTLSWQKPDDGGSPIQEFQIKYKKVLVDEGSDPENWETVDDVDKDFKEKVVKVGTATSAKLVGLTKDSYYEIRVIAINKEGPSPLKKFYVKTSSGARTSTNDRASSLNAGLGTAFLLVLLAACFSAM